MSNDALNWAFPEIKDKYAFVRLKGIRSDLWGKVSRYIFERDKHTCVYCGKVFVNHPQGGYEGITVDHVVPLCRGGSNYEDNLVTSCMLCNLSKGKKTIEEWRA